MKFYFPPARANICDLPNPAADLHGDGKFPAFAGDPSMLKMLDSIPPPLLDALSMRVFNLTTVSGFYSIVFIYFGFMSAIAAAIWGSDIISKEVRNKTVEFSLLRFELRQYLPVECGEAI